MFLKNYLSKLLYPLYCTYCYASLEKSTLFCEPCQRVLVQEFDSNELYLDPHYGQTLSLFSASRISKCLFRLFQNPQNRFLSKAIASLFILKLQELPDFWPDYILSLNRYQLFSSSPTFEVQKSISHILKKPLKRFRSIQKIETTKKKSLLVCLDLEELERYRDQIFHLNSKCNLLILLGESTPMKIYDKKV